MSYYVPLNLLTKNNAKTVKGEKLGWITYILYMAPHEQNDVGANTCPMASKGCAAACLYTSGRGSMSNVIKGRRNKANYLDLAKEKFLNQLDKEITKIKAKHLKKGEKVCIRLNGTSDVVYENSKYIVRDGKTIIELHPEVQFYDYTKIAVRMFRKLPKNYQLTFSRHEENGDMISKVLESGGNVSVVFDELPETYLGYEVINGDISDLRFLDNKNVVVGLKYKKSTGKGAKITNEEAFTSGFAMRKAELTEVELYGKKMLEVA